ncbi:hypothetical protein [Lysinibacter cavernae]|uniref:Hemagglutinin n=1 Tax=Lysinibacter cavernae TaxID=1640652 RepID=A0A7X5R3Q8_9MICO|nr:hypothetical protein [Lysinibacter cavernae]NIH55099.1 hypothetical protein [Lysinibacter cavernae]
MRLDGLQKKRRTSWIARILVGVLFVGAIAAGSASTADPAEATLVGFDPGNIISDEVFFNGSAMTEAQIQSFMNGKVPTCVAGYTCLKSYKQTSNTVAANAMCKQYVGGANESTARILYKVAQACGINPQVLLVTLQKEQGLVTATAPTADRYTIAMGFACPDTSVCDTQYYGFFNQVYMSAWQFKRYTNPPGTAATFTWFPVGKYSNVGYHPNAACGSTPVLIKNKATAGLYYYTPYQPNKAALDAGYGAANNACSSYGNRNFYNYFTDWFGKTQVDGDSPMGAVEAVTPTLNKATVTGWAFDPNTTGPIDVHMYIGGTYDSTGRWGGSTSAKLSNAYVQKNYPNMGANHGFSFTLSNITKAEQVCLYAINVGAGSNQLISCQSVGPRTGPPFGNYESLTRSGLTATAKGWAIDPDTAGPIQIHAYLNGVAGVGTWGGQTTANVNRPDVQRVYPEYGAGHGFVMNIGIRPGTTSVCLYTIDPQAVSNTFLGCKSVSTASGPPTGNFEAITPVPGGAIVKGWALDPDTVDPIDLHLYVDGNWGGVVKANTSRPDVGRAYPGYGNNHGFESTRTLSGGQHQVCVFGINVGGGSNQLLGCKTVNVPGGDPFGNYESATANGANATVNGWVIDPDVVAPIEVHAYVNGGWGGRFVANQNRNDVGRAYPAYGPAHGFSANIALKPGRNEICLYSINVGSGTTNPLMGCRVVNR